MQYFDILKNVMVIHVFIKLKSVDLFTGLLKSFYILSFRVILSFSATNIKQSTAKYYPSQNKELPKLFAVSLK